MISAVVLGATGLTSVLARSSTGEGVKSGPWGLAIILLLCVAAYFLFKSMSRHLKRVRTDFPPERPTNASVDEPDQSGKPAQPTDQA